MGYLLQQLLTDAAASQPWRPAVASSLSRARSTIRRLIWSYRMAKSFRNFPDF